MNRKRSGGPAPLRAIALAAALVGVTLVVTTAGDAVARPAGFVNGTDSSTIPIPGSGPYREPVIGGTYDGYVGMVGNWSQRSGCKGVVVWSRTDSARANTDLHRYHQGIGTGGYWFMAGPGVDPRYDGTESEAWAWGRKQAAWALAATATRPVTYPVLFMDIEIPGHAPDYTPADDNGWNRVYTAPCSGRVSSRHLPANVDRADLNGFAAYVTHHSTYKVGVYSAPDIWRSIFGTGEASLIPNTYEWTYEANTTSLAHHPDGWCLAGTTTCAQFFGGQTSASPYALMWQWSGGGGSYNGHGDFDQIDTGRPP